MQRGMIFSDRYRLQEKIGEGGMSTVYRAEDIRTGHSVAVKILKKEFNGDREFLERFLREAQAVSRLSHHNLVNLLDVGVEGDYRFLVLEYVKGETLKQYIQKHRRLKYTTAIQIAIRILSGLEHAHKNGIIHRDIKPQNVLMDSTGLVKVSDFGIARIADTVTISQKDTVVGSVHYSSPEQVCGSTVTETGDIYSTGVVLYEMLTGHVPFVGNSVVAVAMQHKECAPPPIERDAPETPPAVIAVVMKALEKKPENRFQSAREMAQALKEAGENRLDLQRLILTDPATLRPVDFSEEDKKKSGAQINKGKKKKRRAIRILFSCAAVLLCVGLLGTAVYRIYKKISAAVIVPDIVGLSSDQAQIRIEREGLVWQQIESCHEIVPAGKVISQIPAAETELEKGDSILATVSRGPETLAAPEVIGTDYEEAAKILNDSGFSNVVIVKTVSEEPLGTVLSQIPVKDEKYTLGDSAEITVSGGSASVPDLVGRDEETAVSILGDSPLTVGTVQYVETQDETLIGTVLSQNPAADSLVVIGASVSLSIGTVVSPYQAEISVALPRLEESSLVRVVLSEGETEETVYEGEVSAGAATVMLIPVTSSLRGERQCKVYLGEEVILTQMIMLQ